MLIVAVAASLLIAFIITFLNGMNDAANAISTVIATRVLSPKQAVIWAAFWEFMAFFIFKVSVAQTIGSGIAQPQYMTPYVILSALIGAALWVWVCTRYGMPISTSQAIIGGVIGPVWFVHGTSALISKGIITILAFIVLSPIIGMIVGFVVMCIVMALFKKMKKNKVDKIFKRLQLLSSAAFSLGHGANDAQKTMGIIAILMLSTLQNPEIGGIFNEMISGIYDINRGFYVPNSLAITCYAFMIAGIIVGGKRVIKTMGIDIAKIDPEKGFSAEFSGATTLIITSIMGIPVSTSHTITGSIIGVSLTDGVKSVSWNIAKKIIWAWIWTIPAPLIISGVIYLLMQRYI